MPSLQVRKVSGTSIMRPSKCQMPIVIDWEEKACSPESL